MNDVWLLHLAPFILSEIYRAHGAERKNARDGAACGGSVSAEAAGQVRYRTRTLRHRFREHGAGYQVEGSTMIRADSTFIHQEVVRPALTVLRAQHFDLASYTLHLTAAAILFLAEAEAAL